MKLKSAFKWIIILFGIPFILGCNHWEWKSGMNQQIGKNIYNPKMHVVLGGSFEQAKKGGQLYKETQEPPNTRYYFNWYARCHYSLLVSPDGTILSWDFAHYKKRKECYIF